MKEIEKSGLIWITGFSASGKTTIARRVEFLLKKNNYKTIYLDGDDLRAIFGNSWGYDRFKRIELAYIYFRLCNHLCSQGYVVVISAVAMFDDVAQWVKENINNSMQIYLEVPGEIRRERDAVTKGIFLKKNLNDKDYDIPTNPDLVIANYGEMDTNQAASKILKKYIGRVRGKLDYNRGSHWDKYYNKKAAPSIPSSFAKYVLSRMKKNQKILEIGCGNGRDAVFFEENGHKVTAIDRSIGAIELCKKLYANNSIKFYHGMLVDIDFLPKDKFNLIYSRFVFHAMPLHEEIETIKRSSELLELGGFIYIECRSVNDQLFRKGKLLSKTERVDGHYRRFLVLDELIERLENSGFKVLETIESNGLAVYGDDDPVVIRICAEKI